MRGAVRGNEEGGGMSHELLLRFRDGSIVHRVVVETETHYTLACGLWVDKSLMTRSWVAKNNICSECAREWVECSTQSAT